jgi:hypothetical protein
VLVCLISRGSVGCGTTVHKKCEGSATRLPCSAAAAALTEEEDLVKEEKKTRGNSVEQFFD